MLAVLVCMIFGEMDYAILFAVLTVWGKLESMREDR